MSVFFVLLSFSVIPQFKGLHFVLHRMSGLVPDHVKRGRKKMMGKIRTGVRRGRKGQQEQGEECASGGCDKGNRAARLRAYSLGR